MRIKQKLQDILIKRMGSINAISYWQRNKKQKRVFKKLRDKGVKKLIALLKKNNVDEKRVCFLCPYKFDTHTMNCTECCPKQKARERPYPI